MIELINGCVDSIEEIVEIDVQLIRNLLKVFKLYQLEYIYEIIILNCKIIISRKISTDDSKGSRRLCDSIFKDNIFI